MFTANPPESASFPAPPEDMSGFLFTITLISMGMGVIALSVAIMMPLNGVVTRLRAQYHPKRFQLKPKYDIQPYTGPVITSFFAMLVRVYRIEGLSGLYKGLVPTLLDALILILPLLLLLLANNNGSDWKSLLYGIGRVLLLFVSNLMKSTPLVVLINRAIITRHKLPYFSSVLDCLRVLLTPTERRRPWILCQMFGIWSVLAIQTSYLNLFTMIRNRFLQVPHLELGQLPNEDFFLGFTVAFVLALANTLVLTPLQVINLRLSLQRTNAPPEAISSSEKEGNAAEAMGDFGTGESVISLRVDSEAELYTDPVDCARKIISEEGWGALYRAWWWTTFTLLILS